MNVQYAIKDGDIYVLEVNPRASRTVPFVAKVTGMPVAKIAARIMAGRAARELRPEAAASTGTARMSGVKEAVFPFARFRGKVDTVLGPGDEIHRRGHGHRPRLQRRLRQEPARRRRAAAEERHGLRLGAGRRQAAHPGTGPAAGRARLQGDGDVGHPALSGRERRRRGQDQQGRRRAGRTSSMPSRTARFSWFSTPPKERTALADSRSLRRAALLHKVPYYTTLSGAVAAAQGIKAYLGGDLEVCALQNYFAAASDPISGGEPRAATARVETELLVAWPDDASARDSNFVSASKGGLRPMDKIPMTAAGYSALEAELKHCQQVERPRIIQQITDARTHGDLSENAEYHAAKESQSLNEGRIAELEDKLARAEVIDVSKLSGDTITFGATVTLIDEDTDKKAVWQIVGEPEADAKKGKISITSPLARALVGKKKGAQVEVVTPGGAKAYEVVKVEWR